MKNKYVFKQKHATRGIGYSKQNPVQKTLIWGKAFGEA